MEAALSLPPSLNFFYLCFPSNTAPGSLFCSAADFLWDEGECAVQQPRRESATTVSSLSGNGAAILISPRPHCTQWSPSLTQKLNFVWHVLLLSKTSKGWDSLLKRDALFHKVKVYLLRLNKSQKAYHITIHHSIFNTFWDLKIFANLLELLLFACFLIFPYLLIFLFILNATDEYLFWSNFWRDKNNKMKSKILKLFYFNYVSYIFYIFVVVNPV